MSFGEGLGKVIGGNMADNHLDNAIAKTDSIAQGFGQSSDPYNNFGKSFLDPVTGTIDEAHGAAGSTKSYDEFMSGYTNTPGVQYQLQQADARQNNTALAKGGLLSGENARALSTIDNGIISTGANTAYDQYLKGSSTQFGQLESIIGNMFSGIGVGTTVSGQQAQVAASQIGANAKLAGDQAKNDQSKGSGIGSMFSGLAAVPFMF